MKKLIVDMDGVLADVYRQFIKLEKERYGCILKYEELSGIIEEEAFPHFHKIVNSAGFFRQAPVMPGSTDSLRTLNGIYDVRVVSSATEFPNSLKEKYAWLKEHFPFITWQQMTFCGSKDIIKGDIMLDDHPVNLNPFDGGKLLFTQPHNEKFSGIRRIGDWYEVVKLLIP